MSRDDAEAEIAIQNEIARQREQRSWRYQSWRHQQAKNMERLHPQSWRELRQLVKLHGAKALVRAIQHIEEQEP